MTDERTKDAGAWGELGAQWRAESAPNTAVDIAELRKRSSAFARTIFLRNLREAVAAMIVIAIGLHMAWNASTALVRSGGVTMALGALFILVVLLARGRNRPAPASDAPTRVALMHEQSELERQARLLEGVWLWYLLPLVPSLGLLGLDGLLRALESGRAPAIALAVAEVAFSFAALVLVHMFNRRAARRLRERMVKLYPPDDTHSG